MTYRIGIVGTGGIAHSHVEGYRAVAGDLGAITAACDPDEERLDAFCAKYGIPHRFTNARELIDSGEVDVLSLLTPPSVRAEVIFPATDSGIHLLVEKPFAESLDDAVAFVNTAERASTTLAVNQSLRFMPDIFALRDLLDRDEIGAIRFIEHSSYQNRTRTSGWRSEETRLEIGVFSIHVLDRIRWLCGALPESVNATTRHWSDSVRGETFTTLTIQFAGGAVGNMVSNWHSPTLPECRLRIDGTHGSILARKRGIAEDDATLTVHRTEGESLELSLSRERAAAMSMGESMRALLRAVDDGAIPHHCGRDNLQTMAVVDAAYLSASRGGELVMIEDLVSLASNRSEPS